jgi:hypothetical protein
MALESAQAWVGAGVAEQAFCVKLSGVEGEREVSLARGLGDIGIRPVVPVDATHSVPSLRGKSAQRS